MKKKIVVTSFAALLTLPALAGAADYRTSPPPGVDSAPTSQSSPQATADASVDQTADQVEKNLQKKKSGPTTSGTKIVGKDEAAAQQGQRASKSGSGNAGNSDGGSASGSGR